MPAIPTRGSEPGIGWNIVREVASRHRVWAITRRKNQAAISAELQRAPLPNLRMIYFDLPKPLLVWKKGQVGIELLLSPVAALDSWAGRRSPS